MVDQTIRNLNVPEFLWYQRRYHERLSRAAESKKYIYGVHEFSPLLVPGFFAWYDPADTETCFQERTGASATTSAGDGDPVGTILDKSGNDFHLTAASDAARPIRRLSGGLWYLEFDGTDDLLQTTGADMSSTSGTAVVTAYVRTDNTTNGWVFEFRTYSGGGSRWGQYVDTSDRKRSVVSNGTDFQFPPAGANTADTLSVHTTVYDGSDGSWETETQPGTSNSGSISGTGLETDGYIITLGGAQTEGAEMEYDFYGGVLINDVPTSENLLALQKWLAKRAGLAI